MNHFWLIWYIWQFIWAAKTSKCLNTHGIINYCHEICLWPKKSNIPSLYHVKYTSVLEISAYKIIAIFSLKTMLNNILVGQYSCREPQAGLSIEHEIGIFLLTATFCFYIL